MYKEMFAFVNECLKDNDVDATKSFSFPFRKRSEHTKRVFLWANRLIKGEESIDKNAVLVSAIFHDVGYSICNKNINIHADYSASICEEYLKANGFDSGFIDFVVFLVKNHSRKELLKNPETPKELIALMEADLLDETGALSIIWDCMMEGSEKVQSFEKTYDHIVNYTAVMHRANPMVSEKGNAFWQAKGKLVNEFVEQLAFDIGIE